MRVLVTRPEPAASRTAERLRVLGHEAIVAPLLVARAVDWTLPDGDFEAVAFTSAMAPALGGDFGALTALPAYAVGEATAAAARTAGFGDVRAAHGDASAVFAQAARDGTTQLLHIAGRDRSTATIPASLTVTIVTVYAAELLPTLDTATADIALLYSTRTAEHFAAFFDGDRATLAVAALSPAVAAALGPGWARVVISDTPTEQALFAAAGLTCK